jgi:hypothetical protein
MPSYSGIDPAIPIARKLADDFGTLREAIFPGDKRRLMDMRRSGALEAIAGGAEGFALAAKID